MNTVETVERVTVPVLSSLGIELVDVESNPGHLKLTIDRSAGLDLAAISQATVAVSHVLDESDAIPGGRYELEVSSPGVERRLRRPEHFARFVGSQIAVRLRSGAADDEGERRFEGDLVEAGEQGIVLAVPGTASARRFRYSDIDRAHTLFDWRAALAAAPVRERAARRTARPSAADRSRAAAHTRKSGTGPAGSGATAGTRSGATGTGRSGRPATAIDEPDATET